MKTTKEILAEARELIAKGWTQGTPARNADGDDCGVYESEAQCFCSLGALWRAAGGIGVAVDAANALRAGATGSLASSISFWNDAPGRTQAEVLAAFDKAIAEVSP